MFPTVVSFFLKSPESLGKQHSCGGPNQSRTGDLSMPWTYDPNFTMGPLEKL